MMATKVNVTEMEAKALNLMAYDLYNQSNGSRPTEFNDVAGGVWTWSVSDCWPHPKRTFSGVMSSLVQKGLAWSQETSKTRRGEPDDAAIGMTKAGYEVWLTVDDGGPRGATKTEPEPVREDDDVRCRRVMAMFPETFGLRGFPGATFHVGVSNSLGLNWTGRFSYQTDDEVMLYIDNDKGQGFAKGTVAELRSQMVVKAKPEAFGPGNYPADDRMVKKPTKTFAVYADRKVVAKVHAATWLEAMELAQTKIGSSVTAVRLVRK